MELNGELSASIVFHSPSVGPSKKIVGKSPKRLRAAERPRECTSPRLPQTMPGQEAKVGIKNARL